MKDKMLKVLTLLNEAKNLISELEEEVIKISELSDERFSILISSLQLSNRTKRCLRNADINSVGELLKYSESDLLMMIRNFGKHSLDEVIRELSKIGLKLGDSYPIRQRKVDEVFSFVKGDNV